MPWYNRQFKDYLQIRSDDYLTKVLQDSKHLQYTNRNDFEITEVEQDLRVSAMRFLDGAIVWSDEQEGKVNSVSFDKGAAIYSYDENIGDDEIVALRFKEGVTNYLNELQLSKETTEHDKWIRLLMPKYLRNVEVEDLNRNFWVIGQVLDMILYYLYDPDGVLAPVVKGIGNELEELWNNVQYLWYGMVGKNEEHNLQDT